MGGYGVDGMGVLGAKGVFVGTGDGEGVGVKVESWPDVPSGDSAVPSPTAAWQG